MAQNKTIILSDSTCDIGPELCEKYSVQICPLCVLLDDKPYKDGVDITPDDLYEFYNTTKRLPKTTCANYQEHVDFIKQYTDKGYEVVYFTIGSGFSSNYQNAMLAGEEFENVYIVDSENLSTGIGLMVIKAAEMANSGAGAKEIYDYVIEMRSRIDASFVIENLEFLHKGGRCSAVAALGANLLQLKPCIEVKEGKMGVCKKYRGKMNAVIEQYVKERLADIDSINTERIFVTHTKCSEEIIEAAKNIVAETGHFGEIIETTAGATISVHCGPGTLGVLFERKN